MKLNEYRKKRSSESPEPIGGVGAKGRGDPVFVIQKHDATRLHYDFRLELGGVLKSWAVPKGPSLNPIDKRLSMMVEDHPFEYRKFEGVIPKGNYGAGAVIVWDEGTYLAKDAKNRKESDKKIKEGIEKGDIKFILMGEKIKGEFALVKIRSSEDNSWLLIKKKDNFASDEDIKIKDGSVLSGKTIEEIYGEKKEEDLNLALKKKAPEYISPMLARLTDEPFDKKGWIFEVKWDGYRAIADVRKDKVELYSRRDNTYNELFSPIYRSLGKIKSEVILDGEIVVLDEKGKPEFSLLQNYKKTGKGRLIYYVFDILYFDGFDTRDLPLRDRKELLEKFFEKVDMPENIKISFYVEEKGKDFFEDQIIKNDLEGVVAKNLNSAYKTGKRSEDWLKIKYHKTQEAIICGYSEGMGARHLGALILGVYDKSELRYVGNVGTGFNEEIEKDLLSKLEPLIVGRSPFREKIPKAGSVMHFVEPFFVCEIRYTEWTEEGRMRHPVFLGLRIDKDPEGVTKEGDVVKPPQLELLENDRSDRVIEADGEKITIKNYKKKYWPKDEYTKFDLVNYYKKIAPILLPHLIDRPQSLHRFPDGIESEGFYQKNTSDLNLPDWVKTENIYSESEEKQTQYILCQNEATLIYMANLGCIELNPWNSKIANIDKPDYLVIDLDPLDVPFSQVIEVAKECHKILNKLKVPAFCKTSGATGLHIYVPLRAKYNYEQARMFAEIIANILHEAMPLVTSIERKPEKRKKKVYIDYLQNKKGFTLASVYSVRPLEGAPVSTPLDRKELDKPFLPTDFNIKNIFDRIKEKGDLWRPVLKESADLLKSLKKFYEK